MDKPVCESCGMPMEQNQISKFDKRYCVYCQDQQSGQLKTKDQVREGSIGAAMKFMSLSRVDAEKMADEMMPKLPRWKDHA